MERIDTQCCIVGGGPAGILLGYLLARAGIETTVLEKHADFLRDFRGDTVHPSTLEVLAELGLLEQFLELPHSKTYELSVQIGTRSLQLADFSHLPTRCKFIAMVPQWHFLDFLSNQARQYQSFSLKMQCETVGLVHEAGRCVGARARGPHGELEVRAALVIGADGRGSCVRDAAGLPLKVYGAPIDVLWFRLSRRAQDPPSSMGRVGAGHFMVMIDRNDYWQCAFVIPKGKFDDVRQRGLQAFREELGQANPILADRVDELGSLDDLKLLTVRVDRLKRWYAPGVLCIGDAAHAMSPIGGVGINLAIQDAVAAANLLSGPLKADAGRVGDKALARVQRRRELPTRLTQWLQLVLQDHVVLPMIEGRTSLPSRRIQLVERFPVLQRVPARAFGLGFRPEHVRV